jgi:hypothetical protein
MQLRQNLEAEVRNRLRKVSQPFTRCCDSRLRCRWQRDRNARARGRVQRTLAPIFLSLVHLATESLIPVAHFVPLLEFGDYGEAEAYGDGGAPTWILESSVLCVAITFSVYPKMLLHHISCLLPGVLRLQSITLKLSGPGVRDGRFGRSG